MLTAAETRFPSDDVPGDDSSLAHAAAYAFPAIEEAALATRPVDATQIAVVVGLGLHELRYCAGALRGVANLVVTDDGAAAADLVTVLRPGLVVCAAVVARADGARLTTAAASCRSQLVRIEADASAALMVWLVRRAASLAFGSRPLAGEVREVLDGTAPDGEST